MAKSVADFSKSEHEREREHFPFVHLVAPTEAAPLLGVHTRERALLSELCPSMHSAIAFGTAPKSFHLLHVFYFS